MFTRHYPNPDRKPAGGYTPAVKIGNTVYTSGQVGTDQATGAVRGEEIGEQTAATLDNIEAALAAAGATLADVVKTTVFLTRAEDLAGMDAAYKARFGEVLPARSTVTVAALAKPAFLVEIEAIAVLS
jgi:2-iminobutanoate/2-iminopropanoate deaminase